MGHHFWGVTRVVSYVYECPDDTVTANLKGKRCWREAMLVARNCLDGAARQRCCRNPVEDLKSHALVLLRVLRLKPSGA